jgi:hypothetical protein
MAIITKCSDVKKGQQIMLKKDTVITVEEVTETHILFKILCSDLAKGKLEFTGKTFIKGDLKKGSDLTNKKSLYSPRKGG